ncbi:MAG TPA: DUF3093 domain-containing protein [Micromonosporaceae bacterium]|nr:DUF3093 domain-containing protein [Micromonosporaceae bacterium]
MGTEVTYRERLTVSWWLWPFTLAIAALLATELGIGAVALRHPLTYVVVCGLAGAGLMWLGRIPIRVERSGEPGSAGWLRVDDANLPLDVIADVVPLSAEEKRVLLGREADPLAFVIQRPWVPGGVRIDLDDPNDPTPYWFISSRHPERLAAALKAARVTRG